LFDHLPSSYFDSNTYWNDRYVKGGNSGEGSYGPFAAFKGNILLQCIKDLSIQSIIDYGCGDGNQARYYTCNKYIGIDVSQKAIDLCKKIFYYDIHKQFYLDTEFFKSFDASKKVDCAISCDVILHLIDPSLYISYIHNLFSLSNKYVIIYSYDCDLKHTSHVQYHNFTKTIQELYPNWILLNKIMNPIDKKTGFYIYSYRMDNEISIIQSWKHFIHTHLMPLLQNISLEGNIYTNHHSTLPFLELTSKQYNITHFLQQPSILSKPIRILEIGFNSGFSSLLMLLSHPSVVIECVDIGLHSYTSKCFELLKSHFGDRIHLTIESSISYLPKLIKQQNTYDVIHIDGDHSLSGFTSDFENSLLLSRKDTILLVDDTNISYIYEKCNCSIIENKTIPYSMSFLNCGSKKHRFLQVL
jgi:SAM-dependent methyltransferase